MPQSLLEMVASPTAASRRREPGPLRRAGQSDRDQQFHRTRRRKFNVTIDLGDFDLGTADPRLPDFELAGITPNKIRTAALAALQNPIVQEFLQQVDGFPKEVLPDSSFSKGIEFPILENPETAFGLLLGRDVDLFTMDNATQNLPLYDIDKFIRLVGPFGFRFKGMGNVRLDFDFGFDTKGLIDFASSGEPLDILNGFYVLVPLDENDQPISMAELNADMRASVAANAFVAEVGAGGSLFANAQATLTDSDANGRVHLDEFIENFDQSPLCVLMASGSLDFGLQAYVTIGIGLFSYTHDYDFPVGRVFDFSHACEDAPEPVLAHLESGQAFLHIGPDAPLRVAGYLGDGSETFEIAHRSGAAGSEEIGIAFSGNGGTAGGPGSTAYGAVSGAIRGSGGENNDTIRLAPDVLSPAILDGTRVSTGWSAAGRRYSSRRQRARLPLRQRRCRHAGHTVGRAARRVSQATSMTADPAWTWSPSPTPRLRGVNSTTGVHSGDAAARPTSRSSNSRDRPRRHAHRGRRSPSSSSASRATTGWRGATETTRSKAVSARTCSSGQIYRDFTSHFSPEA
ncbi:MAG: hypothetical protein R3F11_18870 [Verrucomicrobiales bacterium]